MTSSTASQSSETETPQEPKDPAVVSEESPESLGSEASGPSLAASMDPKEAPSEAPEAPKVQAGEGALSPRILLQPLQDARQALQTLESIYPATGLDSWTVGRRLAALVDWMLEASAWLRAYEGAKTDTVAPLSGPLPVIPEKGQGRLPQALWSRMGTNWKRFCDEVTPAKPLAAEWISAYPLQLRAYCQRHRHLAATSFTVFGDNDMELEELLTPALVLYQTLERDLLTWVKRQPGLDNPMPWWRQHLFWIVAAVVLVGYGVSSRTRAPKKPTLALPKGAVVGGLQGSYYQGTKFEKLVQRRVDKTLWFEWKTSPINGVSSNYFSIRWAGYLKVPRKGSYKICIRYDDGTKITLGGRSLIHQWRGGPARLHCNTRILRRGWHRLVVQLFDNTGPSMAKLSWQLPGTKTLRRIPSDHLSYMAK